MINNSRFVVPIISGVSVEISLQIINHEIVVTFNAFHTLELTTKKGVRTLSVRKDVNFSRISDLMYLNINSKLIGATLANKEVMNPSLSLKNSFVVEKNTFFHYS